MLFADEMSFFVSLNQQHREEVFVLCLKKLHQLILCFGVVYCERAHNILEPVIKDQCDVHMSVKQCSDNSDSETMI